MSSAWLPAAFVPPTSVAVTDAVHLRPIRPSDVDIDMVAVHATRQQLWAQFGAAWQWPPATMTRQQDLDDLTRHAAEMADRVSFNYALLPRDESALLGCVYVHPVEQPGYRADAEVAWWTTDGAGQALRRRLDEFVPTWVTTAWPFRTVACPFNRV